MLVPASTVPGESYDSPLWSPDGKRIAFGVYVGHPETGESERVALEVVNADGSGLQRLTERRGLLEDGIAWSPDSEYLAYAGFADRTSAESTGDAVLGARPRDIYLISVDGTRERQLTDTPAIEHDPGWSEDGAFLGFETSLAGAEDRVTTLGMDGAAPIGTPLLGPESEWFAWSPDGRLLLWQELTMVARETYRTTLHAIDREFERPATTVQVVEGLVICAPTWQRLTL
jgi:Tol biopolymer transport system component